MKTTKKVIAITILVVLSILSPFFGAGCGNDTVTGINSSNREISGDAADSIFVEVYKDNDGYRFKVINLSSTCNVNDFHVQFDSTVTITAFGTIWQLDQQTTDLNHGKIGEKAAPGQNPIAPGQSNNNALWVKLSYRGDTKKSSFDWQATRDGITVQEGRGRLPY